MGVELRSAYLLSYYPTATEGGYHTIRIDVGFPGAKAQRLFQVLGVDFWATCILTAGLLIAWMEWRRMQGAKQSGEKVPLPASYELTAGR